MDADVCLCVCFFVYANEMMMFWLMYAVIVADTLHRKDIIFTERLVSSLFFSFCALGQWIFLFGVRTTRSSLLTRWFCLAWITLYFTTLSDVICLAIFLFHRCWNSVFVFPTRVIRSGSYCTSGCLSLYLNEIIAYFILGNCFYLHFVCFHSQLNVNHVVVWIYTYVESARDAIKIWNQTEKYETKWRRTHTCKWNEKKNRNQEKGPDLEVACEKKYTRAQKQINKTLNRNRCWCFYLSSLFVCCSFLFRSDLFGVFTKWSYITMYAFHIRFSSHQYLSFECFFFSISNFGFYFIKHFFSCVHTNTRTYCTNWQALGDWQTLRQKMNKRTKIVDNWETLFDSEEVICCYWWKKMHKISGRKREFVAVVVVCCSFVDQNTECTRFVFTQISFSWILWFSYDFIWHERQIMPSNQPTNNTNMMNKVENNTNWTHTLSHIPAKNWRKFGFRMKATVSCAKYAFSSLFSDWFDFICLTLICLQFLNVHLFDSFFACRRRCYVCTKCMY